MQADTVVPGAGNPQALNRYTYNLNNPVKYTDPSGHTPCEGANADDGPQCFGRTTAERLARFGISTSTLREEEQAKVAGAAIDIGVALAGVHGGTAERSVRSLRLSIVKSSDRCDKCWGEVDKSTVMLTIYANADLSSAYYNRFLVHEIGHILDLRTGPGNGSDELGAATISDANRNYVSGIHPETGIWERTNLGYTCGDFPCEEHPVSYPGGNSPTEDFADMFLNWTYNSFSSDAAGTARYNWMNDRLSKWLTVASNR